MKNQKKWDFENCIVQKEDTDSAIVLFNIYDKADGFIKSVIVVDWRIAEIIDDLDNGSNPIDDDWEDGDGSRVTLTNNYFDSIDHKVIVANLKNNCYLQDLDEVNGDYKIYNLVNEDTNRTWKVYIHPESYEDRIINQLIRGIDFGIDIDIE